MNTFRWWRCCRTIGHEWNARAAYELHQTSLYGLKYEARDMAENETWYHQI
jgi:hypothetical protein